MYIPFPWVSITCDTYVSLLYIKNIRYLNQWNCFQYLPYFCAWQLFIYFVKLKSEVWKSCDMHTKLKTLSLQKKMCQIILEIKHRFVIMSIICCLQVILVWVVKYNIVKVYKKWWNILLKCCLSHMWSGLNLNKCINFEWINLY